MTTESDRSSAVCSVDGCSRPIAVQKAGLCRAHYLRLRRTGSVGPATIGERRPAGAVCSVDGCDRPHEARGLCSSHYSRLVTRGTTEPPGPAPAGAAHAGWRGDSVTYQGAHSRLRRERGSPRDHACADCGQPARRWLLQRIERVESGRAYSSNPHDYEPMCELCRRQRSAPAGLPGLHAEPRGAPADHEAHVGPLRLPLK